MPKPSHSRKPMGISIPLTIAFLVAVVGFATPSTAHLGQYVFPVYEIPSSALPNFEDGTLDDWDETLPESSLNHTYFEFSDIGLGGSIDSSDLALRIFLAWHHASQRLYAAVEWLDDVYVYGDDNFNIQIDGDHSGGQFYFFEDEYSEEERRRFNYSQAQSYVIYSTRTEGRPLIAAPDYQDWTLTAPFMEHGGWLVGEAPNRGGFEFYVTAWDDLLRDDPELSKPSRLEAGRIIGLQITVWDSDVRGRVDGNYTLAVPDVSARVQEGSVSFTHYMFADNFVDAELIPCYVGDCSGATSAVTSLSWARIKASFR